MSALSDLYNLTFTVLRKSTAANRKDVEVTISTGNSGVKRPVTDRNLLFREANWGKEENLYCDEGIDIKSNDILVIGVERYGVDAVTEYEDLHDGSETHLKAVIYKK